MIRISREDTQWAIASKVATSALERLAGQLPKELQDDGWKIVAGKDGFAALLVFGDLPNETLAKQLLMSASPVYLLDFDDDVPVTLKLDRRHTRVIETRIDKHPAEFLDECEIVAPGYAPLSPVRSVGLVEGVSLTEAKRVMPPNAEIELLDHPRGLLVIGAPFGSVLAKQFRQRAYLVYRDPEDKDGWFCCVLYEMGRQHASFSPVRPDPNAPPIDNVLGETTLEGILRVLAIPGELLGLDASGAAGDGR